MSPSWLLPLVWACGAATPPMAAAPDARLATEAPREEPRDARGTPRLPDAPISRPPTAGSPAASGDGGVGTRPSDAPSAASLPDGGADGGRPDAGLSAADVRAPDGGGPRQVLVAIAGCPLRASEPLPSSPLAGVGRVEKVGAGMPAFKFAEGPVWRPHAGDLLFSDNQDDKIYRLVPPGTLTVFRAPSGGSNGLAVDADGRIVAAEGLKTNRRVTRQVSGTSFEPLATGVAGRRFNAPNDVVARCDGNLYFTDMDMGFRYDEPPAEVVPSKGGVYRLSPDGTLSTITTEMKKPNGIALAPDGRTLYVADLAARLIRRYELDEAGQPGDFNDFPAEGAPDGLAVDDAGNVYAAMGSIKVFRPHGQVLGTIAVPEWAANCTFGGSDRRTLYITARSSLYQVKLAIPGLP